MFELRDSATNDEVKKSKKEMWIIHHPDRHVKEGETEQQYH